MAGLGLALRRERSTIGSPARVGANRSPNGGRQEPLRDPWAAENKLYELNFIYGAGRAGQSANPRELVGRRNAHRRKECGSPYCSVSSAVASLL
jgi:hypothetical protein